MFWLKGFIISVGAVGAAGLVGQAAPGLPSWCLQFGALGLCAYMVFRLYGQQKAMVKSHEAQIAEIVNVVREKDKALDDRHDEVAELTRRSIEAYNRLADMLGDRPCLQRDRRIQK